MIRFFQEYLWVFIAFVALWLFWLVSYAIVSGSLGLGFLSIILILVLPLVFMEIIDRLEVVEREILKEVQRRLKK